MSEPLHLVHREQPNERIPDELVDAFFDRELDEGSRERMFKSLRGDLTQCAQVAKTQRMISRLREPIEAPDLTDRIMGELSRQDRFLPARLRAMVKAGRLGIAACLLLGVLGVAIVQRHAPDAVRLAPADKPVTDVISRGSREASAGVHQFATAVNAVGQQVVGPMNTLVYAARAQEQSRAAAELASAAGLPSNHLTRAQVAQGYRQLSLKLSPAGAGVTVPKFGSSAIVVYSGSGPENRFIVPDAIYLDRATAMVMPLGYISPSRAGREWTLLGRDSMFVLPPVEPAPGAEAGVVKVRIVSP